MTQAEGDAPVASLFLKNAQTSVPRRALLKKANMSWLVKLNPSGSLGSDTTCIWIFCLALFPMDFS